MRILLAQDAPYLPSFGGGNKASRCLMAALAARGHDCTALAKAVTAPTRVRACDETELAARGIAFERGGDGTVRYVHEGVAVRTFARTRGIAEAIRQARADWVVVSDDKSFALLDAALAAAPERVAVTVHTHLHLPFGPDGRRHDAAQLARMRRARGIIAASAYVRDYLAKHAGLASTVLRFPVYGRGPFARAAGRYVTLINPCAEKGLPIFLALADAFPETPFAAVPTWGANDDVLTALRARPNVTLLAASDDVGDVLRQTRILLVPSLIAETFGHVTVDAMLRGIPVLASNLGGLPEGKLGVDYVLPVQELAPWRETLQALLSDAALYERCATASAAAAKAFVEGIDVGAFERFFGEIAPPVIAIVEPADAGVMLAPEFERRGARTVIVRVGQALMPVPALSAVVAGSERGVNAADALSEACGVASNGTALSPARRDKFQMIEAVRVRGLRVPAQLRSATLEPLLAFTAERGAAVLKPLHAAGSDGVRLCRSAEEVERAFRAIAGATNVLSLVNEAVLAQEWIGGEEYVVDTVSWDGEHVPAAFWRYGKPAPEYASVGVFTTKELLPAEGALQERLFAYVRGVLDALGIRFGPGHCEVKVDERGPVLIELGARLHGGPKAHEMCRAAFGSSQLDLMVDAYLDPARFLARTRHRYRLDRTAVMRLVRPPRGGALCAEAAHALAHLPTAHDVTWNAAERYAPGSVAGLAVLLHHDREAVERDLRTIDRLEQDGLFDA